MRNVERIEAIVKESRLLETELEKLKGSRACDDERLRYIYKITSKMALMRGWSLGEMREYYMFVVLYMFDPVALIKRQRRGGIRHQVAQIMGITDNNVSYVTKFLLFHYRLYTDFQKQVQDIYDMVWEKCQ